MRYRPGVVALGAALSFSVIALSFLLIARAKMAR
jgi:hypothetical protein